MTKKTTTRRVAGTHDLALDTAAAVLACQRAILADLEAAMPLKHAGRTISTQAELREVVSGLATEKQGIFAKDTRANRAKAHKATTKK